MAELKFNNLPFKTFEKGENMQKEEPTEILTALQKTISKREFDVRFGTLKSKVYKTTKIMV